MALHRNFKTFDNYLKGQPAVALMSINNLYFILVYFVTRFRVCSLQFWDVCHRCSFVELMKLFSPFCKHNVILIPENNISLVFKQGKKIQ